MDQTNYYRNSFHDMNTTTIQMWLREAQIRLPSEEGNIREMLMDGIRSAATELLFRYRHNMT